MYAKLRKTALLSTTVQWEIHFVWKDFLSVFCDCDIWSLLSLYIVRSHTRNIAVVLASQQKESYLIKSPISPHPPLLSLVPPALHPSSLTPSLPLPTRLPYNWPPWLGLAPLLLPYPSQGAGTMLDHTLNQSAPRMVTTPPSLAHMMVC